MQNRHSVSNPKQVVDVDSSKSDDIYLSSWGKHSSSAAIKCFPTYLLVSLLTSWYSSKVLLSFYLALLPFLFSYILLTQSIWVVLNLNILAYILLRISFFIEMVFQFLKALQFFMNLHSFLISKILKILQFLQYPKIYERMENVGIDLFYRIFLLAAMITTRLLILKVFMGMKV